MTVPELARRMDDLRARMKPLQAELTGLEAEFRLAKESFIEALLEEGGESYATSGATYSLRRTEIPVLQDAEAFFGYVAGHDAWDLVRKQCNLSAARERWEQGIAIPGVAPGTRVDLSVRSK
jgi:hypothetical protein